MIRLALLLEIAIPVVGVLFLVFQVLIPCLRGTPFFPFLRHRHSDAITKYVEATEEKSTTDIEAATLAMMGQGIPATMVFAANEQNAKKSAKTKGKKE